MNLKLTYSFLAKFFCFSLFSVLSSIGASQTLELVGIGTYNEFGKTNLVVRMEEMAASSELANLDQSAITNRLSIRIVEPKTDRRWGQFWSQNLSLNNSVDAIRDNFDALIDMTGAIRGQLETGDLVEFEQKLNDEFSLIVNEVNLINIQQPGFYDFMLTALVGPIPASSALKQQLLGEDTTDQSLTLSLFDSLGYDSSRTAAVSAWIPSAPVAITAPEPVAEPTPEPVIVEEPAAPVEEPPEVVDETTNTETEAATLAAQQAKVESQLAVASEPEPEPEPEALAEADSSEQDSRELALEAIVANQRYMQSVLTKIYSNIEYPRSAVRQDREGTARVELTINRDGSLDRVVLVDESDYNDLNEAALASVTDSEPFDPMPEMNPNEQITVQFPIRFALN